MRDTAFSSAASETLEYERSTGVGSVRNGSRAILAQQPFRLLAILLREPGSVVTREDLQRELWRMALSSISS
jgi:DNA-binding winged helix-turn-helix (wHTH) protein